MKFEQNRVLQEFDRINNTISEFYHEINVRQGLSDSAYEILQAILILGDGCTQTEIIKYSLLNKQTVNSSVKKLKADGYIEFLKGNGREVKLHLTSCGKELVNEKILPILQAENEVFQEMTEDEQREILRLMSKYLDNFRDKVITMMGGVI